MPMTVPCYAMVSLITATHYTLVVHVTTLVMLPYYCVCVTLSSRRQVLYRGSCIPNDHKRYPALPSRAGHLCIRILQIITFTLNDR
jgi:hypothetical protein